ncbi:hypothetical protein L873DRAFT_1262245 [Choiromyces venosus 120613-1]|uniref:Zn(2)-C6 fungal-type domain-containing protein n=1 Tax=Choiromyces venosus 120613-1 TaxID=1336337 RepID=A0A3N4JCV9_9PEZI|nr:hypothetical protein L873DRAFT_1262245 [Choiromyces venosus 120613-1]
MPTRKRAPTACDSYCTRKTKSDNSRPACGNCAKSGMECFYSGSEEKELGLQGAISENYKDFLHLTTTLAALAEAKKAQADLANGYYAMARERLAQAFVEHSELAVQCLFIPVLAFIQLGSDTAYRLFYTVWVSWQMLHILSPNTEVEMAYEAYLK